MDIDSTDNCEMDIKTIRKTNFLLLLENDCGPERGRNREMADKLGMDPNYVSLIKTGRRKIGDDTARRLERGFDKPHGWMDVLQNEESAGLSVNENQVVYKSSATQSEKIPVLLTAEVFDFLQEGTLPNNTNEVRSPLPQPALLRLFAWKDTSNTNAPFLPAGTLYTIIPVTQVANGLMAAVAVQDQIAVGIYELGAFGEAALTTANKKHDLPSDHRVIGKVYQILPSNAS